MDPSPARPIRAFVSPLARREGFALPVVVLVLVALAFVGGAGAVLSSMDLRIAGLHGFSHRAAAAAGAALEHATAHFVTNGPGGWPVTGSIDGYAYTVAIERDRFDFGAGEVEVSWDPPSGYNGVGTGEAVWVLTATASKGPFRAEQRLRLTSLSLNVQSDAAFVANAGIRLQGNVTVTGINSTMEGQAIAPGDSSFTGACDENKPAIRMTGASDSVDAGGSATLGGNETFAGNSPPFVVTDSTSVWHTPTEVLGLPDGALDSYQQSGSQYGQNRPDTLSGITYITDDFGSAGTCATEQGCGNIQGTGILIVHNPLFDPAVWQAWAPDPPPCSPACDPAKIGNVNGGTFKGIIIADKVDKIDGNVRIFGSVVSMSEIDVNIVGAGSAEIRYSCSAIETVSNSIVAPRRLAWTTE